MEYRFPDTFPELASDLLRLRAFEERDVAAWFVRLTDVEAATLAGDPIPESIELCYDWLEAHREAFRNREAIRWAIVPLGGDTRDTDVVDDAEDGDEVSVGSIGLFRIEPREQSAEIGCAIGRDHWGQGLATAATRLVVRYAFDTLGLDRLQADVLVHNCAAQHVLEATGFRQEGRLRQYRVIDGDRVDGFVYALCRSDRSR